MSLHLRKNVMEVILAEYAKLIADAAVEGRTDRVAAARTGGRYWAFVTRTFKKLMAEDMSPSSLLRENKLFVVGDRACVYCGSIGALQWEHIIPRSRGGPDTIDNLVWSCSPCNGQKSAQNPIDWYWKRGLHQKHIPRLVMGKLLKLVLEEHRRRGTLLALSADFPPGQHLLSHVCRVFEWSPPVQADSPQSPDLAEPPFTTVP